MLLRLLTGCIKIGKESLRRAAADLVGGFLLSCQAGVCCPRSVAAAAFDVLLP